MSENPIVFLRFVHLRGPNLWTYRPVLEAWVDIGHLEDRPSDTIPGFPARLADMLPGLVEHRCSYGERGGFLRRLAEGTWPAHILEHVTLELQHLAGMPGGFGRARSTAQRGVYKVAVRAWHQDVTRTAFHLARDLLLAAMYPADHGPFDVSAATAALHEMADRLLLGASTRIVVDAATAKDRRIPAIRLGDGNLVQLGYGARSRRIWIAESGSPRSMEPPGADMTRPLCSQGGVLNGLDAGPSVVTRIEPEGGSRPDARTILDQLFPEGATGRIPVIGVAGSRCTTGVARLLAWLLGQDGRQVGLACGEGLFLGGALIASGDCAHWEHGQRLLVNPACEVAVIENGMDVLLYEGLAYDRCQVGVVTNIDPNLLPQDGYVNSPERLCALMRTQVDVVLPGGAAVLNAADPLVAELVPLSDGEIVFFAADPACPVLQAHRGAGGRAVSLGGGRVLLTIGASETALPALGTAPWVENDPHQAETLLAAVAAAWSLGMTPASIRGGIASFRAAAGGWA